MKTFLLFILLIVMNIWALFFFPLIFLTKLMASFVFGTFNWLLGENETWFQSFQSFNESFDLYSNPWTDNKKPYC